MTKRLVKERVYMPGGNVVEFFHDVTRVDGGALPRMHWCKGCRRDTQTGTITETLHGKTTLQLVCWKCCWGHTPPLATERDIVSFIEGM